MKWRRKAISSGPAIILILAMVFSETAGQVTLRYQQNETVTWQEAIDMYRWLDRTYTEARLMEAGTTDAGKPLHLFIISEDGTFSPGEIRESGRGILFINNGIHPGEPGGIDASLKLAGGLLSGKDPYSTYLKNTVVVIVPVLNVGGALNRSLYHRANQNGPVEHGFRGNARNLDLNRDFMKLDAQNTRSLVRVIREWDPDLFADTHTTNGADYPYTVTLINSHQQRHQPPLAELLDSLMLPWLFDAMDQTPFRMSPYFWTAGRSPREGIVSFMDYPRYTSGYVSLFDAPAFTIETHMFKPFAERVESTWRLLREMLKFASIHQKELLTAREESRNMKLEAGKFTLEWQVDSSRYRMIPMKGYRMKQRISRVTGHPVAYFDRSDPWEEEVRQYRYFSPVTSVKVPEYYLLPSAWTEAVERLQLNGVVMEPLPADTLMEAEVYYIEELETSSRPYNGHYRHTGVNVRKEQMPVQLFRGDWKIPVRQPAIELIVQALEPQGYDSWFRWNFFDEVLFRNEYFSPYIFDHTAEELLEKDPELKRQFRLKQETDPAFADSPYLQLRYIYEHSPWSEPTYRRYPVYRSVDGLQDH